ncbi:Uncharacterized copper-binding protein, cupredoxin-like subfamily [Geodermatophilus africanus]|uniref:Uncharacterized copper-binding protein, cupredoxin-like subfamily n=1 Tax=Geodermatophilus africanus TaxID=1137993 RepID=A0A1H3CI68_9ACTN|nr:plastocyanin/azurin family copper-binding protein [Geodermatophilus africanus]SDX53847.1 Uncharacterized copper-binding protein, cupredoxin-like subfamily [Geodermatophilus africanus]
MPDPTTPARSPRRAAAALVLAVGIGLVAGCSGDDAGGTAADTPAADTPAADTSAAAPSSSAAASAPSSPAAPPAEAESETVAVTEGEMYIELAEDSYSAGSYTFEVVNEGRMPHDFVVERDGADVAATDILQPGQSATLTVTLEQGDYVFYCSVGSHRASGMETPVTVDA